ncbi:MAG: multidrug effflux MFS transporter [Sulfitobacter sp.]
MAKSTSELPMGRNEFIALMAMMFATIAFSIDAMLPALPMIAAELTPQDPTRASWILTSFVLGMGLGTFVTGPLSDALGRKTVVLAGSGLYIIAAGVAWLSSSLEVMLAARLVQGLGAAGPRVVSLAIVRDLFAGREMARIMSVVMMIFTIVPAVAPAMGVAIISFSGWHGIFVSFMIFSAITVLWLGFRLPETLPKENRRALSYSLLFNALREIFSHPTVRLSIMVQTLAMAMLFSILVMIQPIYEIAFDRLESFPFWFGGIALVAGSSGLLNAVLVVRIGMRRLVTTAMAVQFGLSWVLILVIGAYGPLPFAVFLFWQFVAFFQAGLTVGNLNAIAMEPMGHIAGMAASVIGSVSTVLAAIIASVVGQYFDGTPIPLIITVLVLSGTSFWLMVYMARIEDTLAVR